MGILLYQCIGKQTKLCNVLFSFQYVFWVEKGQPLGGLITTISSSGSSHYKRYFWHPLGRVCNFWRWLMITYIWIGSERLQVCIYLILCRYAAVDYLTLLSYILFYVDNHLYIWWLTYTLWVLVVHICVEFNVVEQYWSHHRHAYYRGHHIPHYMH